MSLPNPSQDDNDVISDVADNCPMTADSNQLGTDGDGLGDAYHDDDTISPSTEARQISRP